MSAWVFDPDPLRQLVLTLYQPGEPWVSLRRGLVFETTQPQQMVQDLMAMNVRAVNYRYSRRAAAEKLTWPPAESIKPMPIADFASQVHCLRYQCMEGSVPEEVLWQALDTLAERLDEMDLPKSEVWGELVTV